MTRPRHDPRVVSTVTSGRAVPIDMRCGDFLIFREDPTKDLSALGSLEAVVARGRLFTKQPFDAKLAEYRAQESGFVFDRLSVRLAAAALRGSGASQDGD